MSMKITPEDFLGTDEAEVLSSESIAFKAALDFEADVFRKLQEKNLSQKDLANLLDVSPAAVSKMLTKGANITIKTMAKIAHALDCVLDPIRLKDAVESNYFNVGNSETVTASIKLDERQQEKGKIVFDTIRVGGNNINHIGLTSSFNSKEIDSAKKSVDDMMQSRRLVA